MGSCTSVATVIPADGAHPLSAPATPYRLSSPSFTPTLAFPPSRHGSLGYDSDDSPTLTPPLDDRRPSAESNSASNNDASDTDAAPHLRARRNAVLKFRVPRARQSPRTEKDSMTPQGDPIDLLPIPRLQVECPDD
jgi:hypothetical protein